MTWFVMVSWDSTEVASHYIPQIPGSGAVSLGHLYTFHPPRVRLLLTTMRWIFDNREVILNLLSSGWDLHCSEAMPC